ncbi:MAG: MBL fold metallo-hydrolase, partial [Erysipelotrichales bacterium]|nr:MBL fold metallo-hydrolase [Erysipelotrichales bacterium]
SDTKASIENAPFAFSPPDGSILYSDGAIMHVGSLDFHVIQTPGHSPGSVTLRCGNALFTGDTLFRDSCGRTDLPGGDMDTLMLSLKKLALLPGDYEVYPGHMDSSTLERERRFNYYINCALNR